MYTVLISIVWGLFAVLFFYNVFYIRVRAFKYYRRLVNARVEFGTSHVFNKKKMETEIIPKYPKSKDDIEAFVGHIHRSINVSTGLMVLITLFGAILMYYRK